MMKILNIGIFPLFVLLGMMVQRSRSNSTVPSMFSTPKHSTNYHEENLEDSVIHYGELEVQDKISLGTHGDFFRNNFFDLVRNRPRLPTQNPCYHHLPADKAKNGIFCLPYFYILGPQKCGTTDTFERIMRHPNVVRLNPKINEHLEPHLWTNQIEEGLKKGGRGKEILSKYSKIQFGRHSHDIVELGMIGGDASASLMYREAVPALPTAQLLYAVQPTARLIAVLRDPVERTYSDFRFFFHCDASGKEQNICPRWWPSVTTADLDNPALRFHNVVQLELQQFNTCLEGQTKTLDNLFKSKLPSEMEYAKREMATYFKGIKAQHPYDVPNERSQKVKSFLKQPNSEVSILNEKSKWLHFCSHRPDLNREAYLNKCYSGRAVLSVYAAFVVDWLEHFPGNQLLVLPLEGLDKSQVEWVGGIYKFLELRMPTPMEWSKILPDANRKHAQIKKKTSQTAQCQQRTVKFGPMMTETKLLLREFYNPWNHALKILLRDNNVSTVAAYPIERSKDDILNALEKEKESNGKMESEEEEEEEEEKLMVFEKEKVIKPIQGLSLLNSSNTVFNSTSFKQERKVRGRRRKLISKESNGMWWWDYSKDVPTAVSINPVRVEKEREYVSIKEEEEEEEKIDYSQNIDNVKFSSALNESDKIKAGGTSIDIQGGEELIKNDDVNYKDREASSVSSTSLFQKHQLSDDDFAGLMQELSIGSGKHVDEDPSSAQSSSSISKVTAKRHNPAIHKRNNGKKNPPAAAAPRGKYDLP